MKQWRLIVDASEIRQTHQVELGSLSSEKPINYNSRFAVLDPKKISLNGLTFSLLHIRHPQKFSRRLAIGQVRQGFTHLCHGQKSRCFGEFIHPTWKMTESL